MGRVLYCRTMFEEEIQVQILAEHIFTEHFPNVGVVVALLNRWFTLTFPHLQQQKTTDLYLFKN